MPRPIRSPSPKSWPLGPIRRSGRSGGAVAPGPRWKPELKASEAPVDEASSKPPGDGDGREDEGNKGDGQIERPPGH